MFKIITSKKLKSMLAELDELEKSLKDIRGQHVALHQLYKGLVNKYKYDIGVKEDAINVLKAEKASLNSELTKYKKENNRLRDSLNKVSKK